MKSSLRIFFVTLFSITATFCSSSDEKEMKGAKLDEKADSSQQKREAKPAPEEESFGSARNVTTVLSNADSAFENSVPDGVLSDVLMAMEQSAAKKSKDLGFLVTYLGLARLQGRNFDLQRKLEERIGPMGARNPWFLLEASYVALLRKNYALAEYLLDKAEKLANSDKAAKLAVKHALAVRYLIVGKIQTAVNEMRKVNTEGAFLPTSLTLGFLALRAGDFNGADGVFRAAASNFGDNVNVKIGLAASARGRGQPQEAVSLLKPLYESNSQDRRYAWNYALALADNPASKEEAIALLKRYFQLPGSLPEADSKANALLAKLQRPPPPPPKPAAPAPAPTAPTGTPPAGEKPNPAAKQAPAKASKEGNNPSSPPAPNPKAEEEDESE